MITALSQLILKRDLVTIEGEDIIIGGVHKLCLQEKGGRWSKESSFCKLSYHRKCKWRGVGGQKKSNFVNVFCERPHMSNY